VHVRLALPTPRVSALLVLAFLAFGVLVGRATRPAGLVLASSDRPRLKLVLPATAPSTSSASANPSASASAGREPPESEVEPTPAPAARPAHTTTGKKPSGASAKPTGEGGNAGKGGSGKGGASEGPGEAAPGTPATKLPAIKHVFVIMLSDEPYAAVFGPESSAPYLAHTLEGRGELLVRYDAVAHEELADEVALLSGQGPTVETAANCPTYTAIAQATVGASDQVLGSGCVYPPETQTLMGQLTAKHLSARAYVEGIDEPGASAAACAHPQLGQPDPTSVQSSSTGAYATFRNPFVYFQSLTGTPACATDDVGLGQLRSDLGSATRTPSFSYIVPDRCHDANPVPCTPGAPAGLAPADGFLQKVVPEITASKAYKQAGLLVITVDEAPSSGEYADSSSCCGQPRFPNVPATTTLSPRGGGTVGALLLSPYVKGATISQEPFNHFSLLRTIEDLFGLGHLGYAASPAVKSFEPAMFTQTPASSR
jgi:phosphatidylinositol-3-phosphatase